jgi:hypothetical protein
VRTRASASGNFTRTLSTPTDSTKFTFSAWIKRGLLGSSQGIFQAGNTNYIQFGSADTIQLVLSNTTQLTTTPVFRDPSAWGHLVVSYNNAASPKWNFYYNSVNIGTSTASNTTFNTATAHGIANPPSGGGYFDGYLTEINFIDGQALTPSSFGSTNAITGVWQPAKYTGTYGTNGFYLNFSDNSNNTAATIGKDYSGNGNNWTPNNVQIYDSVPDTPSNNFCVMNPLYNGGSGTAWLDGNLKVNVSSTQSGITASTFGISSGKWYWEIVASPSSPPSLCVGIIKTSFTPIGDIFLGYQSEGYGYYSFDGKKVNNNSFSTYGSSWEGAQFVISIALDMDAGTIVFYRNNVSQGTAFSSLSGTFTFAASDGGLVGTTFYVNFGADSSFAGQKTLQTNTDANGLGNFFYAVPSGYLALCSQNLPASTITNGAAYMAATLYTGTGASLTVANTVGSTSFQPDWVWAKSRSAATDYALYDSVRGVQKQLESNQTGAETTETTGLTAFGSTGFTVGALAQMNTSAATYVAWQWKAGTTSASNTNGSITSTVSVGATQGFSVVTYTGTGVNATVGHGLGVAPSMIIVKRRTNSGTNWNVYHISTGNTGAMFLDTTNAFAADSTRWNNTTPTSTVFSIGTGAGVNTNTNSHVAYCFAAVAGYSAFGSYTGNGSTDGTFVYTGFRPRWLLIKRTTVESWILVDSSRDPYNVVANYMLIDTSNTEANGVSYDFVSNGIKFRGTSQNQSSSTYIYAAFAENPFKNSLAR